MDKIVGLISLVVFLVGVVLLSIEIGRKLAPRTVLLGQVMMIIGYVILIAVYATR